MRVLLSTYGSRGDVEPMVGPAVQSRALGAEVRVCALPDFAELLVRECDAPVATGAMPTGVWR
jgi:vancomycin aglycone glucosyltransferase